MLTALRKRLNLRLGERLSKPLAAHFRASAAGCRHLGSPAPKTTREDFRLVMMTGRTHLEYLRQCLGSICHQWHALPSLILVSDGSLWAGELTQAVRFYGAPVRTVEFGDIRREAQAEGLTELAAFADRHVMGKKLLSVLWFARSRQRVLWCDSDFLWFRTLSDETVANLGDRPVAMTEDCCCSYDPALGPLTPNLSWKPPYFNAGLTLVSEDLRRDPWLREIAAAAARAPGWHSEQTVLSALAARSGGPAWTTKEIYITDSDQHAIRLGLRMEPSYRGQSWLARHYATAREQFWRDAAALGADYARGPRLPSAEGVPSRAADSAALSRSS